MRKPADPTEAVMLILYGRGWGQVSDAEATLAAKIAYAVILASQELDAG